MYPSRRQRFEEEDVHVFPLEHDIPICESVSPVSSYRWHSHERGRGRRVPAAAHQRGRRLDGRDRGAHRRPVRPGDRAPRVHEHGRAARRQPAPGRRGPAADDGAVLRARHRAEDVQQRTARRRPGRVPAAVPAVHATREDLRLRRPGTRRRRRRRDLRRTGAAHSSTCSPSSRANASCSRPTATTRTSSGRCPTAPTAPSVLAGFVTQPLDGSDLEPDAGRAGGGVRRRCRLLRQVRRLEAAGRAAARGARLRAGRPPDPDPGDRLRSAGGAARDARAGHRARRYAAPTSSARARRTSWRCCSAAPTSAASRPTASRSDSCSSSAWPAVHR